MRREVEEFVKNKTIEQFNFSKEKITFTFAGGDTLTMIAEGGCCSESWFEQISGEEALVPGAQIFEIEFIDLDKAIEIKTNQHNDCLQYYGVKFKTSKGYADTDMRNLSNGYYGGEIECVINGKSIGLSHPEEIYDGSIYE